MAQSINVDFRDGAAQTTNAKPQGSALQISDANLQGTKAQNSFDRLFSFYSQLDGIYGRYAKARGETYLSLWAFEEIGSRPEGMSQKELVEILFAPKQTISSIIAGLAKRGLIQTQASKKDKRSKIHLLTPKGEAFFADIRKDYDRAQDLILQVLDPERLEQMFEGFALMNRAIQTAFEEASDIEAADLESLGKLKASDELKVAGERNE